MNADGVIFMPHQGVTRRWRVDSYRRVEDNEYYIGANEILRSMGVTLSKRVVVTPLPFRRWTFEETDQKPRLPKKGEWYWDGCSAFAKAGSDYSCDCCSPKRIFTCIEGTDLDPAG